ncbi:MAG: potassium channel family protein [Vulcanimicrobiaceae bacterium]
MLLNILVAIAGAVIVWVTLSDVFKSAIVPREVDHHRVSALISTFLWRIWRRRADLIHESGRREYFLGTYAPFQMIFVLMLWVALLIVGYGLIFFALRTQLHPQPISLWAALYFAGTSLLTIGFGDIVGQTGLARLVSLVDGASGLGVVAVVTSYLFAVFGAYQRREAFVVVLRARAGTPPSGAGLLAVSGYAHAIGRLPDFFQAGQFWMADVVQTHLAYPILGYFRSKGSDESWIGTLGTLLDAATLLVASVADDCDAEARFMFDVARRATRDLTAHYRLAASTGVGIERCEFDAACDELCDAGYRLQDREAAWLTFGELRSTYAMELNGLARYLDIPPVRWVGDRSFRSVH